MQAACRCRGSRREVSRICMLKPLLFLASAFINTFGITQPTPRSAERAAWFIGAMMLAVLIIVAVVALALAGSFHSH